jgi:hypothetical protein
VSLLNRGSCGDRRQQREERSLQILEDIAMREVLKDV